MTWALFVLFLIAAALWWGFGREDGSREGRPENGFQAVKDEPRASRNEFVYEFAEEWAPPRGGEIAVDDTAAFIPKAVNTAKAAKTAVQAEPMQDCFQQLQRELTEAVTQLTRMQQHLQTMQALHEIAGEIQRLQQLQQFQQFQPAGQQPVQWH